MHDVPHGIQHRSVEQTLPLGGLGVGGIVSVRADANGRVHWRLSSRRINGLIFLSQRVHFEIRTCRIAELDTPIQKRIGEIGIVSQARIHKGLG
jgi:hypothetical protein